MVTKGFILVLLLICPPAYGQDMGRISERDDTTGLRGWSNRNAEWLVPATILYTIASQGLLHGALYDTMDGSIDGHHRTFGVHESAWLHANGVYALGYLAGADAVQLAGITLVSDVAFSGLINYAVGRPFFYAYEEGCWEAGPVCYPKPFSGKGRIVQLGIGVAILAVPPAIRYVKRRVSR